MPAEVTYANGFAELFGPLVMALRGVGFFEAHVFLPLMTTLALVLHVLLLRRIKENGVLDSPLMRRFPNLLKFGYFTLWFVVTNSTAVAFKTMIFEETDYDTLVWFFPLVSPLHFYITSVAASMLWLVWRNKTQLLDQLLSMYAQFGLLGGYYAGYHRIMNEPWVWTDVTSGVSGLFFFLWFALLNVDVATRYFKLPYQQSVPEMNGDRRRPRRVF